MTVAQRFGPRALLTKRKGGLVERSKGASKSAPDPTSHTSLTPNQPIIFLRLSQLQWPTVRRPHLQNQSVQDFLE